MAETLLDALGPVLTRWTIGGSAIPAAPAAWRAVLGDEIGEAELRLLALSGQLLGALTVAEPAGEVRPRGDIPSLARPPLPEPLRPRVRRLLQALREPSMRRHLLVFLDGRGWTLHPGDWMPGPGEDVPEVYAPWQDWADASQPRSDRPEVLDAGSWDSFGPAMRHAAIAALRRQDPARAAGLLAEKIGGEAPGHRLRFVEAMATGLSDADRPLLERLTGDRAPRVKAVAAALLARLGHGDAADADATELAEFFSLQTWGLLRRTRAIVPRALKIAAQRDRRAALFQTVSFDAFARALGLSPTDLAGAWTWGSDVHVDLLCAAMAARSATDAIVAAIVAALTAAAAIDLTILMQLLPRLTAAQCRQIAIYLLRAKGAGFAMALIVAGGAGGIDEAIATPAGEALLAALGSDDAAHADQAIELQALGLLASRAAAAQALERLAATGLIASDPRLDMLRLNAALEDRRPTE